MADEHKSKVKRTAKALWTDSLFWQIMRAGATAGAVWKAALAVLASLGMSAIMYQSGKQVERKVAAERILVIEKEFNERITILDGQIAGLESLLEACKSRLNIIDVAMKAAIAETEKARAEYAKTTANQVDRTSVCAQLKLLGYPCR